MLKRCGVALSNLVSAQGPLVLGLGLKGFGLRVWGPVLDNIDLIQVFFSLDLKNI